MITTTEAPELSLLAADYPCLRCDGRGYVDVAEPGSTIDLVPRFRTETCDACKGDGAQPDAVERDIIDRYLALNQMVPRTACERFLYDLLVQSWFGGDDLKDIERDIERMRSKGITPVREVAPGTAAAELCRRIRLQAEAEAACDEEARECQTAFAFGFFQSAIESQLRLALSGLSTPESIMTALRPRHPHAVTSDGGPSRRDGVASTDWVV